MVERMDADVSVLQLITPGATGGGQQQGRPAL